MLKQILISGVCLLILLSTVSSDLFAADENSLRVMTFNIRYNTPNDGVNAWPNRKDHVANLIVDKYQTDIVGVQEALRGQVDDMAERMPDYAWVGVGRDDGKDASEFTAIFYKKDRFELLEHDTFWLSEQPEVPGSKSWDTSLTRICTWAKLKDNNTNHEFYIFNTHFDHRGQQARLESAKLIVRKIKEIASDLPTVLTGDFNTREDSDPYRVLVGKLEVADDLNSDLADTRYESAAGHQGPTSTFTNWKEHGEPETRIDFIFVRNGFDVLSHKTITDKYNDYYPSDHLPVIAILKFE